MHLNNLEYVLKSYPGDICSFISKGQHSITFENIVDITFFKKEFGNKIWADLALQIREKYKFWYLVAL